MSDLWSWQNYADSGAITTNAGAEIGLPLNNLKDPRLGKIWRASIGVFTATNESGALLGADGEPLLGFADGEPLIVETMLTGGGEIYCDLGQDRALAVIGIFNANLAAMSQVELRLGTAQGAADVWRETVDPASIVDRRLVRSLKHPTTGLWGTRTARHLTIAYAGSTALEVGRIWAGPPNWRPRYGHVTGSSVQGLDFSTRSITPRQGAFLIDRAARRRVFRAAYDMITDEEYNGALLDMDRDAGLGGQMLFVPNPDVHPYRLATLGYLTDLEALSFTGFLRAAREFSIQEAG